MERNRSRCRLSRALDDSRFSIGVSGHPKLPALQGQWIGSKLVWKG